MKLLNFSILLLLLTSLSFVACSNDDDDCTAPEASTNIIGTWNILEGEVEFQSDGTLIDPDDVIIGFESNGVVYSDKSWSVTNNTLSATAAEPNGPGNISIDTEITDNQCDEIVIDFLGFPITMTRK